LNKVKLGVLGSARGIKIVKRALNGNLAEVKAVCEPDPHLLAKASEILEPYGVVCVSDFGRLLSSGIDALIIANAADKHAIYAIRAMRLGLHVLCDPMPVSTLDEAFLLERTVRECGRVFAYNESCCYRRGTLFARDIVRRGDIGSVVCVEGNYINDESHRWAELTAEKNGQWRNYMPSTFFCSRSIGPMLFTTGLRPIRVSGAETPCIKRLAEKGAKNGTAGYELIEFDGGAVGRSLHGSLNCQYDAGLKIYGESGCVEVMGERVTIHSSSGGRKVSSTVRAAAKLFPGMQYSRRSDIENAEASAIACFVGKILGEREASAYSIDLYSAFDMSLPGLLAYRSILDGGRPYIIPDLRDDEGREFCRGDRFTTDPRADEKYRLPTVKNIIK
jgi:predicted dehydrogenase